MDLKHLYITYSDNQYNPENDSFYAMDPSLLSIIAYDERVANSLVFDTNRKTIYAKGLEFGGLNPVFLKVEEGTGMTGTNLAVQPTYFVTSVSQDKYGQISYTYSYAYLNLSFGSGHLNNAHGGAYMTGMYVDNSGNITYEYAEVNHTTTPSNANTQANRNGKGIIIDVNLSKEGNFTYTWYDASVSSGTLKESYTMTNAKPINVLTGITQSSYGQISYTYTQLNTTHSTTGVDDGDLDDFAITYVWLNADGQLSYKCRNQETAPADRIKAVKAGGDATITLTGSSNSYTVVTQVDQAKDGKILYTYAYLNTTHSSKGSETSAHTLPVLVNTYLSDDGILSYTYVDLSANVSNSSGNIVDIGRNEYTIIDGIKQEKDGKISYSYRTLKTTHNTSKTYINSEPNGDEGTYLMTGVSIDNNGDISYSYTKLVINQSAQAGTLTYLENENITGQAKDHHSYLVTWIYKNEDEDDKVTFTYTDISVNSGTVDTQRGKGTANATFLNNTAYRLLTNISQAGDGKISYTYADFNTSHSQVDHTRTAAQSHVITNINITADGVLSYDHKALSQTGTSKGTYIINNGDTSPEFVYNIVQNADGSITYNTHKIKTKIDYISDNVTGAVYEVSVDANGQTVSYAHKNLTVKTGSRVSAPQSSTNGMGEHIPYQPGSYTYFITGISQDAYGKVSYTYAGIYSDAENNYKYHDLTIVQRPTANVSDPTTDTVNVLDGIVTTNGNSKEHEISYHTVSVATKHYVDNLMTANDALRYCGTVTPSNAAEGEVIFYLTHDIPVTSNDTSKGAVYKVNGSGYFGTQYVTSGDMIISADDGNSLVIASGQRVNYASLNSDFNRWDIINNNVNLITDHKANAKNGSNVITVVNLDDAGTFSYTAYPLSATNDPTYAAIAKTTQDSKSQNILVGDNTKGFRVITDVNLTQNDLDTKLSYTYTYLYVDQNHHSNNSNGAQQKKVVSNVNLNTLGQLTYEAHALSATGTDGTAYTMTNTKGLRVLTNIWEDGDGAISYTYRDLNTTHTSTLVGETGASKVIGYVNLDANGNFTYSYVDIATSTYHYAVTTTSSDSTPDVIVPYNGTSTVDLTAYSSITNDDHGHITNSTKPTYKIKHGPVTTSYTKASENVTIPLNGTDSDGLLSYIHETIENGHVTGAIKISYNLLHGKVNSTGTTTGTHTTPNAIEISAGGTDSSTILAYSAITDVNGHMTTYTTTEYKFKHGAVTTSYSNGSETVTIPLNGTDSDGILSYNHATTNNGHLTGLTKVSYNLIHGKINGTGNANHTSLGQKTITIPIDATSSVDLTSYVYLKETNGHITDEKHGSYVFAHGAANTQGSAIAQNTLVIPYNGTDTSDEFVSYKSITTNNGHITSYVRTSYVLKHQKIDEDLGENHPFDPERTMVLSNITRVNGHITKVHTTTVTDANVKFIKDQSNSLYLGGTRTAARDVISNAYIDGVSYINNGTLYETNVQVGSNLSVGGNSTLGNAAADTVTINASNFNWSSAQMNFTNLGSLWGTITITN